MLATALFPSLASRGLLSDGGLSPMDVVRRGDSYIVTVDLPGVARDTIDVTVQDQVLTVTASRQVTHQGDDEVLVAERASGQVQRTLRLGRDVDTEAITATYADGVLTVHLPIAESAKPKRIEIATPERAALAAAAS